MVLKCLCTLQYWIWEIILANADFQQKSGLFSFSSEALIFLKEMKGLFGKSQIAMNRLQMLTLTEQSWFAPVETFSPFSLKIFSKGSAQFPDDFIGNWISSIKLPGKEQTHRYSTPRQEFFMNWWWRTTARSEITFQTFWPKCTLSWI